MSDSSFIKRTASIIALASALPGSTVAGGLLGAMIDRWLGTAPIGAVAIGALGFAGATAQLLRISRQNPNDTAPPPSS
jgi:F0F1-type ATP synthase assembly protein I